MHLPSIAPGKRFTLPRPTGSADALLIARHAAQQKTLTTVITAEPADAQRLADELPFFAPGLRIALFPDWETLPYDTFSPHQDLISERLATLWRLMRQAQATSTSLLVPRLDRADPPGAAQLPRRLRPSTSGRRSKLDEAALKGAVDAGRLHARQLRSSRRASTPCAAGSSTCSRWARPCPIAWTCSATRSTRSAPSIPDTQRSLYPVPEVRLLPGREFPFDEVARTAFRARAGASRWRATRAKSRIYKDIGAGVASAGIEYYLPLFFDADRDAVRLLCAAGTHARAARRRSTQRSMRFWHRHPRAPPLPAARPRAIRSCRRKICS